MTILIVEAPSTKFLEADGTLGTNLALEANGL